MIELLHHYAGYGLWANTRFVERLRKEPDAVLDRAVPSSFPSRRPTLLHIRNAEHIWWCRLSGAVGRWPAEENEDIASVLPYARRFHDLVRSLGPDACHEEHGYQDLRGNTYRQPAWMMVMHCINHGTQHRGQLITMMRALGSGDIPSNDLVVFQRSSTAGMANT